MPCFGRMKLDLLSHLGKNETPTNPTIQPRFAFLGNQRVTLMELLPHQTANNSAIDVFLLHAQTHTAPGLPLTDTKPKGVDVDMQVMKLQVGV